MITRTPGARATKAEFLVSVNDIDVYVEDLSRETRKLFAHLLSNAWEGILRVESVIPLGSRDEVLSACRSDQGPPDKRRRVYIIDGDLDLLHRVPVDRLHRLYRLPRYCVENYIIDEQAAVGCVAYESEDLESEEVRRRLRFDEWLASNARPLRRLFVGYAAANALVPSMKTVSTPLAVFKSDASGVVDPLKIESFLTELRLLVDRKTHQGAFESEIVRIERDFVGLDDVAFMMCYVSGKDHLFPLLRLRMGSIVHIQRRDGLLKCNMAERVKSGELMDILDVAA